MAWEDPGGCFSCRIHAPGVSVKLVRSDGTQGGDEGCLRGDEGRGVERGTERESFDESHVFYGPTLVKINIDFFLLIDLRS
jgi:hypothetical protein